MPDNSNTTPTPSRASPLAVVGIGASAGGMDALEQFFSNVQEGMGLSYILLQHLDPAGGSVVHELVSKMTPLPVVEIGESTALEPNCVYISPPHSTIACHNGELAAVKLDDVRRRASLVDLFFQSLAEAAQQRAIGVVLSGAGADGTLGLKAIADAGGMTIAQDSDSAKYDSMPGNAAATGVVDHVLPPAQMFAEIVAYARHVDGLLHTDHGVEPADPVRKVLPSICSLLLERTDHDFKHYKSGTLVRRVLRRMHVRRMSSADEYLKLLQANRDESQLLFRELLIGVTSFFRDPDTFALLAELVIPKLFEQRGEDEPVRVWIPGCATGEEAYTIAMLLREAADQFDPAPEFQIFATDINERALNIARQATYPLSIAQQLTETRLKRFFVKRGQQYEIVKEIRDRCTFSAHNLIADPPFSRVDLISCRNLLIYLGPHLQQKLIPVFHFSLRTGGYLLLGPSENLTAHTELFRPVDQKHRISQRRETGVSAAGLLTSHRKARGTNVTDESRGPNDADILQISQRILLDEFAPRYAVVDDKGRIICMSGGLEKYFEFPEGTFRNNALKLARPGLRGALRTGLHEAARNKRKVTYDELTITLGEQVQRIQLTVQPMPDLGDESSLYMVVFRDIGTAVHAAEKVDTSGDNNSLAEQLERELSRTRDELETTVQEVERANEELKSSNEELLTMNEELQTANEELETSKEEIEAGLEALDRSRSDLENLLHGTRIATIFLDAEGQIKSFTPAAAEIYNLRTGDSGRPLTDFTHNAVAMPPLPDLGSLRNLAEAVEDEIEMQRGRWYLRRVLPYEHDGRSDGTIVTFVDISNQKTAAMRLAVEHHVTRVLTDADSFEGVIPEIVCAIRDAMEAEVCLLWVADERTQRLTCIEVDAVDGLQPFVAASRELQLAMGDGLPGAVWQQREPVWLADVHSRQEFARAEVAAECGLVSGVATPIIVGKKFRGLIEVYTTRRLAREPELLQMLGAIGGEIGQFIRRHQLDDKLRDEEARKTAILDAALDCIITMDIEGNIVDFNAAAERTFGHRGADVVGRPLADVIIPEAFRDAHRNGMARFLRTGESKILGQRIELTAQRADGSQFPVELAINVSHQRGGAPFFTGYLRDITDRKHWETELADREAHLRRVINNQLGLVGVIDRNGTLLEVDDRSMSIAGLTRDDVIGKHFADCGWWNYDDAIAEQMRQSMERAFAGEIVRYDVPLYAAGDRRLMIDFMLAPVWGEDGRITHLIPSGIDISERVEAERALRDTAVRLEAIVNTAVDGIITIDADGTINSVNPAVTDVFGYSVDELIGQNVRMLMPEPYHSEHDSYLFAFRETGVPKIIGAKRELLGRRKDGSVFPLDLAVSETFLAGDHCFVGIVRDVTQRKEAERAVRESERRAQEASTSKSEFLANMSHEIRTPMTAVLGYTDLLAAREVDLEKLDYLRTIKRNGNFLLDIINDILDLSKIEAGKMDVCWEEFPPQEVVGDVRSMMEVRAREKDLQFEVEYDGLIPAKIESDPRRLKQILVNLIGNAIKFTEAGSVRLVIRFRGGDEPQLQFDVIDTGIGMSDQQQAKLFQPFSQGDAAVNRTFGGTGLGLAISQRLTEMLGGRISVTSELDRGSTFSCLIAVGDVDLDKLIQPTLDSVTEPAGFEFDGRQLSCRVLVVDDRRDVRFLAKHFLERAGATVELAEDGQHALEAIERIQQGAAAAVDLVLLDMQMPRLDGYQTATRIREMGFRQPLIALTADAMHGDMRRCLRSGCDAYLSKPIDAKMLLDLVADYTRNVNLDELEARRRLVDRPLPAKTTTDSQQAPDVSTRVLLVDDSVDACKMMQRLLQLEGFTVEAAFDGESAIALAQTFQPTFVILDITLRGMTGFEVLQSLKPIPQLQRTRFFALTGHTGEEDIQRSLAAGFDRHLTKPIDTALLIELLSS